MKNRNYIGIACTGHENALAIVNSAGEIVFAEGIERYLQNKRAINTPADDPLRTPKLIEKYCEKGAEIVVARSWSDAANERMRSDAMAMRRAMIGCDPETDHDWLKRVTFHMGMWDTFVGPNVQLAGTGVARHCEITGTKIIKRNYVHHKTHAAYGCLVSGLEDAVAVVFDGYGEGSSNSYFHYKQGRLQELDLPKSSRNLYGSLSSLGMYYGHTICGLFGFEITNGEEWKVMGLAPYGNLDPELYQLLKKHIFVDGYDIVMDEQAKGTYQELQRYAKRRDQSYEDVADVAFTAQHHFSEMLIEILSKLHKLGLSDNLVMGGGCALNSTLNGLVTQRTPFRRLFVPPAPSDDGNAIGAALLAYHEDHDGPPSKSFHSPYLGCAIDEKDLTPYLQHGSMLGRVSISPNEVIGYVAEQLALGKIVGWVQGRAEFGPRALGNRSILADPRRGDMKDRINQVVKFREKFRPFAPSILDEYGDEYFEHYESTPYMERTLKFKPRYRALLGAVCHVDGTGRLQSVRREWNPRFYDLISAFHGLTGTPMLLNTSLNVMGKPIVHSAGDAFNIFLSSGIDVLVIDDHVFAKSREPSPPRAQPVLEHQ